MPPEATISIAPSEPPKQLISFFFVVEKLTGVGEDIQNSI